MFVERCVDWSLFSRLLTFLSRKYRVFLKRRPVLIEYIITWIVFEECGAPGGNFMKKRWSGWHTKQNSVYFWWKDFATRIVFFQDWIMFLEGSYIMMCDRIRRELCFELENYRARPPHSNGTRVWNVKTVAHYRIPLISIYIVTEEHSVT